jgi:hypothetical protein
MVSRTKDKHQQASNKFKVKEVREAKVVKEGNRPNNNHPKFILMMSWVTPQECTFIQYHLQKRRNIRILPKKI